MNFSFSFFIVVPGHIFTFQCVYVMQYSSSPGPLYIIQDFVGVRFVIIYLSSILTLPLIWGSKNYREEINISGKGRKDCRASIGR